MDANLYDDHGACMYKLINGAAVERSEEERMADWPEEPEPEQSETEQLADAARILFGEEE